RGIMLFTREQLEAMIGLCHKSGMQVAIHAIGDGALDILLDCIEKAKKEFPRENERHGIIHCQVTSHAQVDRMREMDLIAYIQPIFLNYDLEIVEDRLGPERAATAYNWKEFVEKGIHTVGGSDCPVESLDIMENIYAAVQRKNLRGEPAAGWRTGQCLTVEEALRMFTIEGAYASFGEDRRGSITPGKSADFVIIDENIRAIDPEAIKDIRVKQTWVEGEQVYAL
ncbi:amidohydrolase family protein, partial [Ruminococcaceae bacterium OttesenSCG-928-D13]|nr:amidohydrolase family protein [Ruminococcaceae bacterium OttesenSCG-928-D13]